MRLRRERVAAHVCLNLLALPACLIAAACGGSASGAQPPGVPALFGDGSVGNRPLTVAWWPGGTRASRCTASSGLRSRTARGSSGWRAA